MVKSHEQENEESSEQLEEDIWQSGQLNTMLIQQMNQQRPSYTIIILIVADYLLQDRAILLPLA